jgi:hypothetical protein
MSNDSSLSYCPAAQFWERADGGPVVDMAHVSFSLFVSLSRVRLNLEA